MQIFILIIAVILILVLQFLLGRKAADGITADIRPEKDAVEPGEEFDLILQIENTSRMIRPFVRYSVVLPDDFIVSDGTKTEMIPPNSLKAAGTVFLMPRRGMEKKIRVMLPERGNYRFGSIVIETGDFIGFREYRQDYTSFRSVSVYPKDPGKIGIGKTPGSIMGDWSVRRYIFEDPVLTVGSREYTGREPMKDISWIHSARTGRLMVRSYDHTSDISVSVIMDTEGADNDQLEMCCSLVRGICRELDDAGAEYDFFLNALSGAVSSRHYFPKGMGERHYYGILLQLANVLGSISFTGVELIRRAGRNPGVGHGMIVVFPENSDDRQQLVRQLRRVTGEEVTAVFAQDYIDMQADGQGASEEGSPEAADLEAV